MQSGQMFLARRPASLIYRGGAAFFVGLGVFSAWLVGQEQGPWTGLLIGLFWLGFSGLLMYLFRESTSRRDHFELTPQALISRQEKRSPTVLPWREIESVQIVSDDLGAPILGVSRGRIVEDTLVFATETSQIAIPFHTPNLPLLIGLAQLHLASGGDLATLEAFKCLVRDSGKRTEIKASESTEPSTRKILRLVGWAVLGFAAFAGFLTLVRVVFGPDAVVGAFFVLAIVLLFVPRKRRPELPIWVDSDFEKELRELVRRREKA